jgi:hypothetical protein
MKKLAAFICAAVLLTVFPPAVLAAEENQADVVIEFEDMDFDTEDTFPSFTKPYVHEALPVEAGVDFNVFDEDLSLLCEFEVEKSGEYLVYMDYIMNHNHGTFKVELDGNSCGGPVNFNNGGQWALSSRLLGSFRLEKGTHVLKITGIGGEYYQGILDCLRLRELDAPLKSEIFEFAGESFTKSSDFFLENPFPRADELPVVDSAIWVDFAKAGEYFEGTVFIPANGTYKVSLSFILNNDSGALKFEVDDVVIGENVNIYHAGGWEHSVAELGVHTLTYGMHTLKVTCLEADSGQYHAWLHQLIFEGLELEEPTEAPEATATEVPATKAPATAAPATDVPADNTVDPAASATGVIAEAYATAPGEAGDRSGGNMAKTVIIICCCAALLIAAGIVAAVVIKRKRKK